MLNSAECIFKVEINKLKEKWLGPESNQRHMDFQSTALPTELPSHTQNRFDYIKKRAKLLGQHSKTKIFDKNSENIYCLTHFLFPHMFLGIFSRVMFTMSRRRKLILATHNTHKQKEMNALLDSLGVNIIGLDEYPHIGDIEETGTTLIENSFIKARAVYKSTGLPSLADDTGLEVDALGGEPGVYSARYAGEDASFLDNIEKLLRNLEGVSELNRTARFRTVVTFVDGSRELHSEGIVEGIITADQKGSGGFGYDPIFLPRDSQSTFSEMTQMEKNKISHRSKALIKMKKLLEPYFKKENI